MTLNEFLQSKHVKFLLLSHLVQKRNIPYPSEDIHHKFLIPVYKDKKNLGKTRLRARNERSALFFLAVNRMAASGNINFLGGSGLSYNRIQAVIHRTVSGLKSGRWYLLGCSTLKGPPFRILSRKKELTCDNALF